jgi:hypothetical protein
VALLTGIVFGLMPARRAADLNPVEALAGRRQALEGCISSVAPGESSSCARLMSVSDQYPYPS